MSSKANTTGPADVDKYIAGCLPDNRPHLENMRSIIRETAPTAEEVISYQIPTFKYHGGLVAYAAAKDHLGFYVMSTTLLDSFQEELKPYKTAASTVRFPYSKPLPTALIKKIVKARMKYNEEKARKKAKG
ncbi:MAG TPA: DUF1801 domain-containing protein [Chitinophaga sp.]|uniref:iron chaperone n=1 Tax=Chitinophaga sp. TaxID=1869181 RepID=UPI002CA0AC87|nr:DUF1801 domain-containing protein [Chitinophaga sp.]HVI48821.1 DUF1801 domain-containing protein [Chitinophaga sp.]